MTSQDVAMLTAGRRGKNKQVGTCRAAGHMIVLNFTQPQQGAYQNGCAGSVGLW